MLVGSLNNKTNTDCRVLSLMSHLDVHQLTVWVQLHLHIKHIRSDVALCPCRTQMRAQPVQREKQGEKKEVLCIDCVRFLKVPYECISHLIYCIYIHNNILSGQKKFMKLHVLSCNRFQAIRHWRQRWHWKKIYIYHVFLLRNLITSNFYNIDMFCTHNSLRMFCIYFHP